MNELKATIITKEILNYLYDHALKLEWSVTHAEINEGVRDILVNMTK
jgi:hypothetical protein